MKLLADSGSTKTKFAAVANGDTKYILTDGINPYYQTADEITSCLKTQLLPQLSAPEAVESIEFYGAGCAPEDKIAIVRNALQTLFPDAKVFVGSDLLGAAKALCGENEGIACILGTGSNSCHYDGEKIVKNVSPLGFILGDEGSGAVLGKLLVADVLKHQAPEEICGKFFEKYKLAASDIIDRVYRQKFPNRFLASFAPFVSENIGHPYCQQLVYRNFTAFIERNLRQYPAGLPVHFTGSIAYHFKPILIQALTAAHLTVGIITKEPLEMLVGH